MLLNLYIVISFILYDMLQFGVFPLIWYISQQDSNNPSAPPSPATQNVAYNMYVLHPMLRVITLLFYHVFLMLNIKNKSTSLSLLVSVAKHSFSFLNISELNVRNLMMI